MSWKGKLRLKVGLGFLDSVFHKQFFIQKALEWKYVPNAGWGFYSLGSL
jgi:hypothetical protein